MSDLVVLAACNQIRQTILSLLGRHHSLGIRPITATVLVHPELDPGCYNTAEAMLRSQLNRFERALVIFDRHGCGRHEKTPADLSRDVLERLERNGWKDRAAVVVIDPELEAWVWGPSRHVESVLGWDGNIPSLRQWLVDSGWSESIEKRPQRPKEAMHAALREMDKRPSAAIHQQLAQRASLSRCGDKQFRRLCGILKQWFPSVNTNHIAEE
jgi:hypothetical protein